MLNDSYVFSQIMDLFGRNYKIYTIIAYIFANENKCCALGGLPVKGLYMLVIGHYKYIISSRNDIIILIIT